MSFVETIFKNAKEDILAAKYSKLCAVSRCWNDVRTGWRLESSRCYKKYERCRQNKVGSDDHKGIAVLEMNHEQLN